MSEAIASVRAQTIAPAEIVVVDDASTDSTVERCLELGVRVERRAVSSGPSSARNAGVACTSAPLIAFLDADDEWLPGHAASLLQMFDVEGVVFAASDADRFGSQVGPVSHGLLTRQGLELPDIFILENPIIQSAVMVRRTAFDAVGGYDETLRYSEDYDLWTRMAELGRFGYLGVATVRRRMHSRQLTYTHRSELVRSWATVRGRALKRRLDQARPEQREHMLSLLEEATRAEVEWAIWTGDLGMLDTVRAEMDRSDAHLGLGGRLRSHAGHTVATRRLIQNARCGGRGLLNRILGRTA